MIKGKRLQLTDHWLAVVFLGSRLSPGDFTFFLTGFSLFPSESSSPGDRAESEPSLFRSAAGGSVLTLQEHEVPGCDCVRVCVCACVCFVLVSACWQLLKAWGAHVTVTCSQNAEGLVRGLGADEVVSYSAGDVEEQLESMERYASLL